MWEPEPPTDNVLRQGDLLHEIVLPKPSVPPLFVMEAGATPTIRDRALMDCFNKVQFVVVSQCCTNEKGPTIGVAPVTSSPALTEEEVLAYHRVDPTEDPEANLIFNLHGLDPLPPWLADVTPRLHVIDLAKTVWLAGDKKHLLDVRVARMDPDGRRRLRLRLAQFYGRPTEEDLEWFTQEGKPPGPLHPV